MDRLFEIGRNFRNEGADATHNPEFTMLEAYVAYGDYTTVRDEVQDIIGEAALAANETSVVHGTDARSTAHDVDLGEPFRVTTVNGTISAAAGVEVTADTEKPALLRLATALRIEVDDSWTRGNILLTLYEHLCHLPGRGVAADPARIVPIHGRPSAGIWCALGAEIGAAYSELVDPVEQRALLTAQSLPAAGGDDDAMELDQDLLAALECAMQPPGGLGLGIDRFDQEDADEHHHPGDHRVSVGAPAAMTSAALLGHNVDLGNRLVHLVEASGGRPTVVLLGGCGVPYYQWDEVVAGLAPLATVRMDRPGMSGTHCPGVLPTLAAEVATLDALLRRIDGPCVVVAHSMAGPHAEAFARAHPERLAGLVLVDGTADPRPRPQRSQPAWVAVARVVHALAIVPPVRLLGSLADRVLVANQSSRRLRDPAHPMARAAYRNRDAIASVVAEQASTGNNCGTCT